jgi:hypothetical protein
MIRTSHCLAPQTVSSKKSAHAQPTSIGSSASTQSASSVGRSRCLPVHTYSIGRRGPIDKGLDRVSRVSFGRFAGVPWRQLQKNALGLQEWQLQSSVTQPLLGRGARGCSQVGSIRLPNRRCLPPNRTRRCLSWKEGWRHVCRVMIDPACLVGCSQHVR